MAYAGEHGLLKTGPYRTHRHPEAECPRGHIWDHYTAFHNPVKADLHCLIDSIVQFVGVVSVTKLLEND